MSIDTVNILLGMKKIGLQFYHSDFLLGVKFFLAAYIIVLIVDVILIILLSGPGSYLHHVRSGANIPKITKVKWQRRWEKISVRIGSDQVSQYKAAILEADQLLYEALEKLGYAGSNLGEKLGTISAGQLEMIEELKAAHQLRNEIVHQADFPVNREKAQEALEAYRKALESLEFI